MKATIFHNPRCSNSRRALELLNDAGADVTVVEYLKTPPSADELRRIYQRAGISAREGLRAKESLAADLDLLSGRVSDAEILAAMVANPILIERPLVETEKGALVARPPERVKDIL